MKTGEELRKLLYNIDRKGYPAYKGTRGAYRFGRYTLVIDHVQGDPFAAPSRVHVEVAGQTAGFPERLYDSRHKRIALQDHLIRGFAGQIEKYSFQAKGSGKSGLISVTRCGQEVLERSACRIDEKSGDVTMRFEVGFPANGRTINAGELIRILFDFLPRCVDGALLYRNLDQNKVEKVMELSEDQAYIREQLEPLGLVAFVADGAILPRASGVSQRPMKQAVPFVSPRSLQVELTLPYGGKITGMGVKKGITLIVGGGYAIYSLKKLLDIRKEERGTAVSDEPDEESGSAAVNPNAVRQMDMQSTEIRKAQKHSTVKETAGTDGRAVGDEDASADSEVPVAREEPADKDDKKSLAEADPKEEKEQGTVGEETEEMKETVGEETEETKETIEEEIENDYEEK